MNRSRFWIAFRITLIYVLMGGLWILSSDRLLEWLVTEPELYAHFQTYKGWFFILASGLILFFLLFREFGRREQVERSLQQNLAEKRELLNEVHHRVRNNLSSVMSLLYLQGKRAENPYLREQLDICSSRIFSMATVHDQLYREKNFKEIRMKQVVSQLADNIRALYPEKQGDVEVELDIGDDVMGLDQAIPCAMLINEALVNSYRHAFPEGKRGKIRVMMKLSGGIWDLRVEDNGVGMEKKLFEDGKEGLGLILMKNLASQLGGKLEFLEGSGIRYHLVFSGESAHEA